MVAALSAALVTSASSATAENHVNVRDIKLTVVSLDGSVATTESAREVELTLAADVLFAFDRASVARGARARLRDVAARIRKDKPSSVRVDGYTDAKGSDAYNLRLSKRRAGAVVTALRRQLSGGAPRLAALGHGAANPIAPNTRKDGSDNPRGRAKNRRVTIRYGR